MMKVPIIYLRPVVKGINPKSKNIVIILSGFTWKYVFGDFDLTRLKPGHIAWKEG